MINVIGSGGGGDAPVIEKNTLQCKVVAKGVDLISEGEIEGLVDGKKSIYLNDVPLIGDDGEANFSGVHVDWRNGTPDQSYLPNYSDIESVHGVGNEVTVERGPIVRSITDPNVNDLRVIISIPSLVSNESDGDRRKTSVGYSIYIQALNNPWQLADKVSVTGKCISNFLVASNIKNLTATYGKGPWLFKVVRNSPDSESSSLQNKTNVASYVTIINEKLTYPNTAYIGADFDAQLFGSGMPKRKYRIHGIKVKIPQFYDPINGTHNPDPWSGLFQTEKHWTDNPVWILYDFLLRTGVPEDRIDKYAFYSASMYCDCLVDDGFGGKERRYRFGYNFNKLQSVNKIADYIAGCFHAKILWASSIVTLMQDRPSDYIMIVGAANVKDGIFNYAGTELKDRHSVFNVAWDDFDDQFRKKIEVVDDKIGVERYGFIEKSIIAPGCNYRGQARRYGQWALFTELYQQDTVTYVAGLDHAPIIPGHVVLISDPDVDTQYEDGGRLKAIYGTQLTLDRELAIVAEDLTAEAGYEISVTLQNGDIAIKSISHINDSQNTIVIDSPFDSDNEPKLFAMWGITSKIKEKKLYRIVGKEEVGPGEYKISGLIYRPEKYDLIDGATAFRFEETEPKITIPKDAIKSPTDLKVESYSHITNGVLNVGAIVSWTHSDDPRTTHYEVEHFQTGALPIKDGATSSNTKEINNVKPGEYGFRVRAIGTSIYSDKLTSRWIVTEDYQVIKDPEDNDSDIIPTPDVAGLEIFGQGNDTIWRSKDLHITWRILQNIDYAADDEIAEAGIKDLAESIKHYVIKIFRTMDGKLLREDISTTNEYIFNFESNVMANEAFNEGPCPLLTIKVRAVDRITCKESEHDAILVVTNLAPSPVEGLVAEPFMSGLQFSWNRNKELDFSHFLHRFQLEDETPGEWIDTTTQISSRILSAQERLKYPDAASIKIEIAAVDTFGLLSSVITESMACDSFFVITTDIDDFAVDASKMFSKVPVLENEIWTGTPARHEVVWNEHNLYFAGEKFVIDAGTSIPNEIDDKGYGKQYIYWNHPATTYSLSDHHPGDTGLLTSEKGFIIAVNIDGVCSPAWNSIANEVIGSAYIMRASINDLHVNELSAHKIKADTILTPGVQIGGAWLGSGTSLDDYRIAANKATSTAQDTADGKRRVFTAQPVPPYDKGDLWSGGANSDLKRCKIAKAKTGAYSTSDWELATKYTDDSGLTDFVTHTYTDDKNSIQGQIDGKIESWFQDTDPSSAWSTADKAKHKGDMWWNTSAKILKRFSGTAWSTAIEDKKALDAYNKASTAQDTADGKRRVFTSQPVPPYDKGDLWAGGASNDLKRCKIAKAKAGTYSTSDWELATKYTQGATWGNDIFGENMPNDNADVTQSILDQGASIDKAVANGKTFMSGGFINTDILIIDDKIVVEGTNGKTLISGGYVNTEIVKVKSSLIVGDLDYAKIAGGPPSTATDDSAWANADDASMIDGGKIHASSSIRIGNDVNGDYCNMDSGELTFWQYIAGAHRMVNSLKRIEVGTATSGVWAYIPGYFRSTPHIIVSVNQMPLYSASYPSQSQTLTVNSGALSQFSTGRWKFLPSCVLTLSSGSAAYGVGIVATKTVEQTSLAFSYYTTNVTLPKLIRSMTASVKITCVAENENGDNNNYYNTTATIILQIYYSGAWHSAGTSVVSVPCSGTQTVNVSGSATVDIVYARIYTNCYAQASLSLAIGKTTFSSYTCNLSGATIVASGKLNYVAIGD